MNKKIKILALETSCDETAAAVVENGQLVLSEVIATQIPTHQKYGGVVPEIASREHLEHVTIVIDEALRKADLSLAEIDAIAVTYGPGLVGALLVGVATAKALAYATKKPLLAVHHLRGHIYANLLSHPDLILPAICLVVSGGHTSLLLWEKNGSLKLLGATRDDAAGEAFDKVSRTLGLGYPGGPNIERMAVLGDSEAIAFPKAWLEEGSFDFSFSGLKSSVLNYLNKQKMKGEEINQANVAASFQKAVVDVLVQKTFAVAEKHQINSIAVAGGVAANLALRSALAESCLMSNRKLYVPAIKYCTDNAAMIGAAAYPLFLQKNFAALDLNAYPNLSLHTE
ncbi:MAG: tRNA (adenosine(37)-N6)-threonylcarbamoyltransferase complex transferase subunit TsaD [Clostridia bacterium]